MSRRPRVRALIVGGMLVASAGLIAGTGWALWPTWQEHRRCQAWERAAQTIQAGSNTIELPRSDAARVEYERRDDAGNPSSLSVDFLRAYWYAVHVTRQAPSGRVTQVRVYRLEPPPDGYQPQTEAAKRQVFRDGMIVTRNTPAGPIEEPALPLDGEPARRAGFVWDFYELVSGRAGVAGIRFAQVHADPPATDAPAATSQGPRIRTVAGSGASGYSGDGGPATEAKLNQPFDVAVGPDTAIYFSDTFNHSIRRVDRRTGLISTVAGCGEKGYAGDGGPATRAQLNEPYGVALDGAGNLFIVDRLNYCIRRVDAKTGAITTIAGTGKAGYSGDGGPAASAMLREPNGISLAPSGRKLYVADVADQRVRVVDLESGLIATFAGTGKREHTGDGGSARAASLLGPRAVHLDSSGNVYICEREGNSVRRVDARSSIITTIAGTGRNGYSGDGGPAIEATFNGPKELDIDAAGNIFVVDTDNQVIRRIDAKSGTITTVAGNGQRGGSGDGGPARAAMLDRPHGVAVDRSGKIYIGDTNNHRIRVVD